MPWSQDTSWVMLLLAGPPGSCAPGPHLLPGRPRL